MSTTENSYLKAASELPTAMHIPIEVEAGGAVVFVVDVGQFQVIRQQAQLGM